MLNVMADWCNGEQLRAAAVRRQQKEGLGNQTCSAVRLQGWGQQKGNQAGSCGLQGPQLRYCMKAHICYFISWI